MCGTNEEQIPERSKSRYRAGGLWCTSSNYWTKRTKINTLHMATSFGNDDFNKSMNFPFCTTFSISYSLFFNPFTLFLSFPSFLFLFEEWRRNSCIYKVFVFFVFLMALE